MPRDDPIPRPGGADPERAALAWRRYRALMGWMAVAALATVLLSLLYLWLTTGPIPLHMAIATILGVGLSVLVGTGLMGLVFLSNRSGHDEDASRRGRDDD